MNVGGRDSGSCDERRDHSLRAGHAKLIGFKVGRTAGLSSATPAVLQEFKKKHLLMALINTADAKSMRVVRNSI